MKLGELKNRMVVEDKNGARAMVVGDTLMFEDNTVHFSVYNSDMTCKDNTIEVRDIVKVYDEVSHFSYIKKGQLKIIWERSKPFHKKDLKNGMLVQDRMGALHLVIDDKLIGYDSSSNLSSYNNDLCFPGHYSFDIVKIYDVIEDLYATVRNEVSRRKLIWER